MKHCLSLFLLCLLLCGCAAGSEPTEATSPEPVSQTRPAAAEPEPLYAPRHPLEQSAPGALDIFPLSESAQGILAMGDSLLLISDDECTKLTLLSGEALTPAASVTLSFPLDIHDPSLRFGGDTLSYYDPVRQETVVLSDTLKEISRIAAPEGMIGSPILSADRNTLYYCTSTAIRAWDLEAGIRRCVKELSYETQELTGLHQSDSILQCRILDGTQEQTLLLTCDTRRLLKDVPGNLSLHTHGSGYYAAVPEGAVSLQLFGQTAEEVRLLTPADIYADCFYLEPQNQVLSVSGGNTFHCYDLDTGLRSCALTLPEGVKPISVTACGKDAVYLLLQDSQGGDLICRWNTNAEVSQTGDTHSYIGRRYTEDSPDRAALAQCQAEAARIGEKYGIQVLVWEDPLAVMPWDYEFQPEYLAPVLQRELSDLDERLSYYPEEILDGIREHFTGLTICLVRQINGSAQSGSVAEANGVQFFRDGESYIAIAAGTYAERALYHELYHVMETRLLTDSTAFDRWESLNPSGFSYDLDYSANARRQADEYLQPESRAFIDTYSMSFPKEDRARIMECAMQSGNEKLFQSPAMQAKLACLCQAIREAYGLKKSTETFRWEQYLK